MTTTCDLDLAAEAALVERARTDGEAFGRLYDRYLDGIYRYHYRRTGAHAEAEDLTAQTFHRALERLDTYEWRGLPFGAWLFRIAHNLVVDRARRGPPPVSLDGLVEQGAWVNVVEFRPADGTEVERAVIRREAVDAAWREVAHLPPMQRRALTLYFARDMSHAEVGRLIGRSEPATKQLVYRAVKTLRARLASSDAPALSAQSPKGGA